MFTRNFMRVFPIRKYANITARSGSVSTDVWSINQKQIWLARPLVYLAVGTILILMFDNFHSADEIIGHIARPHAHTLYEHSIPDEVRIPNEQIIAGFQAINKMRQWEKTINLQKS